MTAYLIWLSLVLGAGNPRVSRISERFGTAEEVYRAGTDVRKNTGLFTPNELKRMDSIRLESANAIIGDCEKHGIGIHTIADRDYPRCLSVLSNPPLVLYSRGDFPDFDNEPAVCIVGPRRVSEYGKRAAYALSRRLASAGLTVVSGGALGCDSYAHFGALKAGGKTVLVLPCGLENGYLQKNEALRRHVAEQGCLLSEYPPRVGVMRGTFPVRNRLLSALARVTIVIEAGSKSGALLTANSAMEQGKEVFVIPGKPGETEYLGSNALLRDGARPLLDVSDIFNEYIPHFPDKIDIKRAYEKPQKSKPEPESPKIYKKLSVETLSNEAKIVYNHLDKHTFYPEEIGDTGLSTGAVLSALTELEIEQLIRALPGGRYEVL